MTVQRNDGLLIVNNDNLEIINLDIDPVYILFFEADWCGPCHILLPILEDMAADFQNDAFFLRVNADRNKKIAKDYHIKQLPTFIFVKNGVEYKRLVGMASKEDILKVVYNT